MKWKIVEWCQTSTKFKVEELILAKNAFCIWQCTFFYLPVTRRDSILNIRDFFISIRKRKTFLFIPQANQKHTQAHFQKSSMYSQHFFEERNKRKRMLSSTRRLLRSLPLEMNKNLFSFWTDQEKSVLAFLRAHIAALKGVHWEQIWHRELSLSWKTREKCLWVLVTHIHSHATHALVPLYIS